MTENYKTGQNVRVKINDQWYPAIFHRMNERGNCEVWVPEDGQETYWETTPDRVKA